MESNYILLSYLGTYLVRNYASVIISFSFNEQSDLQEAFARGEVHSLLTSFIMDSTCPPQTQNCYKWGTVILMKLPPLLLTSYFNMYFSEVHYHFAFQLLSRVVCSFELKVLTFE